MNCVSRHMGSLVVTPVDLLEDKMTGSTPGPDSSALVDQVCLISRYRLTRLLYGLCIKQKGES